MRVLAVAASIGLAAAVSIPRPHLFKPRQSGTIGDTANDVTSGVCKPLTLIFARGTTETGNMGTVVGPPLANSLIGDLSADMVAVQGVNYPADVAGAISGAADPKDSVGATTCSALVQQALSQCATTKVAIAGYSQGAEVVHGCLQNVQMGQVSAAVTFGDPLENTTFSNIDASKTKVYCAQGDAVCYGQFSISAAHLSYGSDGDTTTGAQFIVSALGATNSTTK